MNLPNAITLGRIFLVPLLVVVLLTNPKEFNVLGVSREIVGALIFALASITDWLDGYLARRRGQVTGLGQWMDPLADKLLVIAALVSLVYLDLAPTWMVVVILGREMYVTALRGMTHARGQSLPASLLGKIKLIAQVAAILILILGKGHMRGFFILGQVALWIAMLAAVISAIDYTMKVQSGQNAPPSGKSGSREAGPAEPAGRDRISA